MLIPLWGGFGEDVRAKVWVDMRESINSGNPMELFSPQTFSQDQVQHTYESSPNLRIIPKHKWIFHFASALRYHAEKGVWLKQTFFFTLTLIAWLTLSGRREKGKRRKTVEIVTCTAVGPRISLGLWSRKVHQIKSLHDYIWQIIHEANELLVAFDVDFRCFLGFFLSFFESEINISLGLHFRVAFHGSRHKRHGFAAQSRKPSDLRLITVREQQQHASKGESPCWYLPANVWQECRFAFCRSINVASAPDAINVRIWLPRSSTCSWGFGFLFYRRRRTRVARINFPLSWFSIRFLSSSKHVRESFPHPKKKKSSRCFSSSTHFSFL